MLPMEGIDKVQGKRKKTRGPRGAARRSNCLHTYSHPFEVRRKAVQLCLEESFPVERVGPRNGSGPKYRISHCSRILAQRLAVQGR